MSWEDRKGKGQYYTLTLGFAGRRRRVYLGKPGDPVAELAAAHDALDRVVGELQERARAAEEQLLRNRPLEAGIEVAAKEIAKMFCDAKQNPSTGQVASEPVEPTIDSTSP